MFDRVELRYFASASAQFDRGQQAEAVARLREVVTAATLADVLPLLPAALAAALAASFARHPPVRAVGYWRAAGNTVDPQNAHFPDVTLLVRPGWRAGDRVRLLAYLRAGRTFAHWRGLSPCRFGCGPTGNRCMTDGIWVWPEGLAHYVEVHAIRLPAEFVRTLRRRGWNMPAEKVFPTRETHGHPDDTFWVAWGRKWSVADPG